MRHRYIRKEYDILKIAYMAGIVDGEGSIYIGNFSCNPNTGDKYYQTNLQVTNTDKGLIDWLYAEFGGLLGKRSEKLCLKYGTKPVYIWTVSGDLLTHVCELIQPFLIAKKRQCEIMIRMRATYQHQGKGQSIKGKQGAQPNTKELLDLRQSYMEEMQSLHCRSFKRKNKQTLASGCPTLGSG